MYDNETPDTHEAPFTQHADVDEAIKSMLVTNTGAHFLDSGDAYGRHHEENRTTPPWEKPRIMVGYDFVTQNVYHFLEELWLERDEAVLSLEREFYAYAERAGNRSYLQDMKGFAEERHTGASNDFYNDIVSENTYNVEFGSLSQCLQFTVFSLGDEDLVLLQIHQGADIRGGYTAPRLFRLRDDRASMLPREFEFDCPECGPTYESCMDVGDFRFDADENAVYCAECGEEVSIW